MPILILSDLSFKDGLTRYIYIDDPYFKQPPISTQDRSHPRHILNSGHSHNHPEHQLRPTTGRKLHPPSPTQPVDPGVGLHRLKTTLKFGNFPSNRKDHFQA